MHHRGTLLDTDHTLFVPTLMHVTRMGTSKIHVNILLSEKARPIDLEISFRVP